MASSLREHPISDSTVAEYSLEMVGPSVASVSMAAATGIPACSMARIMRRPTCPKDRPSADHMPFQVTP